METRNIGKSLFFFLVVFIMLSMLNTNVRADGSTVVVGGSFIDYFSDLISYTDSSEMIYKWEKIGGTGELTGGTPGGSGTDYYKDQMKFHAAKVGDITIRLKAVLDNTVVRTVTRSYKVVNPYDSYDWYCDEVKHSNGNGFNGDTTKSFKNIDSKDIQSGSTFRIRFISWKSNEMQYDPATVHYPTVADFRWKQTGTGTVTEVSNAEDSLLPSRTFKAVNPGDITLTFMSKDGKWSNSVSFKIHPDDKTRSRLPGVSIFQKKKLQQSYDGTGIDFDITNYKGSTKKIGEKIKIVSSDNTIATPKEINWAIGGEDGNKYSFYLFLFLHKAGTVKISFIDTKYGEVLNSVKLNIKDKIITDTWKRIADIYEVEKYLYYGEPYVEAHAFEGDTVTLNLGKSSWTKRVPASGFVKFKIPPFKKGTKGKAIIKKAGSSLRVTKNFTVKDDSYLKVSRVTSSSKKMTIFLKSACKGDVIKITAGKKKYKKKIKKTTYSEAKEENYGFRYKQKIPRLESGTKIKIVVYNKFKQVRCKKTVKVK